MRVKFWGTRGGIPAPSVGYKNFHTEIYGGNTSCIEVSTPSTVIALDAGTGIREMGMDLLRRGYNPQSGQAGKELYVFLSHTHWDHIQGIPFLQPFYKKGNRVHFYAQEKDNEKLRRARGTTEQILEIQQGAPLFPVELGWVPSDKDFTDLRPEQIIELDGLTIRTAEVNHPNGCLAYRLESRGTGRKVVYTGDNEPVFSEDPVKRRREERLVANLLEISDGVDVLIHDAQYDDEYYKPRKGWGHSTFRDAVNHAIDSKAGALYLFHHDPEFDDEKVSKMLIAARDYANERLRFLGRDLNSLEVETAAEGGEIQL